MPVSNHPAHGGTRTAPAPPGQGFPSEVLPGPSGEGTVLLDVGEGRGALVLLTGLELDGREIEIRAVGSAWTGEHVAVRPRRVRSGPVFAAVFPSLSGGHYDLRVRGTDEDVATGVAVVGGEVTQIGG